MRAHVRRLLVRYLSALIIGACLAGGIALANAPYSRSPWGLVPGGMPMSGGTFTGAVGLASGTVCTAPGAYWASDSGSDTGFAYNGANDTAMCAGGSTIADWTTAGLKFAAGSATYWNGRAYLTSTTDGEVRFFYSDTTTFGFTRANVYLGMSGSNRVADYGASGSTLASGGTRNWTSSATDSTAAADAGLARSAAAVVKVTDGGAGLGTLLTTSTANCGTVGLATRGTDTGVSSLTANQVTLCAGGASVVTGNNSSLATFAGDVTFPAAGVLTWTGRSKVSSGADGKVVLTDNAGTAFTALQLGGTTSSYPEIKRNSAALNFRLADDSADAAITTAGITASGLITSTVGLLSPFKAATIAADATTFDASTAMVFTTSANTGATALGNLTGEVAGQIIRICGGSSTNATTIADAAPYNLSAAFTANVDDCITLLVQGDNDYIELGRVDN